MVLDWNNPVGLGLFFLMVAGSLALLALAAWLANKALATPAGDAAPRRKRPLNS